MSNRASRRQKGQRTTPHAAKVVPDKQFGVEVDRMGDEVNVVWHLGTAVFSVVMAPRDAGVVARMMREAAAGRTEETPEVITGSGLIIPPTKVVGQLNELEGE